MHAIHTICCLFSDIYSVIGVVVVVVAARRLREFWASRGGVASGLVEMVLQCACVAQMIFSSPKGAVAVQQQQQQL